MVLLMQVSCIEHYWKALDNKIFLDVLDKEDRSDQYRK